LGVRTLTITEEASELLAREKKGKESFSEVIKRQAREHGELPASKSMAMRDVVVLCRKAW
jgi:predicted CopG family antitoxin